jgi:nucleoid DNA-binding protein
MTQAELIAALAARLGEQKTRVEIFLAVLADVIAAQLSRGGGVDIPGVGKLAAVDRAARNGRNPQTGAPLRIPASRTVKLRPAKSLRDALAPAQQPDRRRA